jgi:hypothetical protein
MPLQPARWARMQVFHNFFSSLLHLRRAWSLPCRVKGFVVWILSCIQIGTLNPSHQLMTVRLCFCRVFALEIHSHSNQANVGLKRKYLQNNSQYCIKILHYFTVKLSDVENCKLSLRNIGDLWTIVQTGCDAHARTQKKINVMMNEKRM